MISFRDIDYILAAARLGTFSAAAHYCHVSQPSLSMQIKKVEQWLGQGIFTRHKNGLTLTTFGQALLPHLVEMQQQLEQVKQMVAKGRHHIRERFLLGVIPTVAPYLLPQLMKIWREQYPTIDIILKEAITDDLLRALAGGSLDGAILSLASLENQKNNEAAKAKKKFLSYPLVEDDFLLAVKKDSAMLQDRDAATILKQHRDKLILLGDEHCLTQEVKAICQGQANQLGSFRATSLETIRHLVAVDDRLTLIPRMAQKNNDDLAYLAFDPRYYRRIGLVLPQDSTKLLLAEKLAGAIG